MENEQGKPVVVTPLSESKLKNEVNYLEFGKYLDNNKITENDLKGIPDEIDNILITPPAKAQLLSDSLDFDKIGLSYVLNEKNQIVRHQMNENLEVKQSLVLNTQVKYFNVDNSLKNDSTLKEEPKSLNTLEEKVKNAIKERYPDVDLSKAGKGNLSINPAQELGRNRGIEM